MESGRRTTAHVQRIIPAFSDSRNQQDSDEGDDEESNREKTHHGRDSVRKRTPRSTAGRPPSKYGDYDT